MSFGSSLTGSGRCHVSQSFDKSPHDRHHVVNGKQLNSGLLPTSVPAKISGNVRKSLTTRIPIEPRLAVLLRYFILVSYLLVLSDDLSSTDTTDTAMEAFRPRFVTIRHRTQGFHNEKNSEGHVMVKMPDNSLLNDEEGVQAANSVFSTWRQGSPRR